MFAPPQLLQLLYSDSQPSRRFFGYDDLFGNLIVKGFDDNKYTLYFLSMYIFFSEDDSNSTPPHSQITGHGGGG